MRDDHQAYLADVCAYGRNQSQVAALIKMEIAKLRNFNFQLINLHCQELGSQGMHADCGCSRNTASTLHCSHLKQCASRAGIEEAKFAYEANVNLRVSQTIIQYIIFEYFAKELESIGSSEKAPSNPARQVMHRDRTLVSSIVDRHVPTAVSNSSKTAWRSKLVLGEIQSRAIQESTQNNIVQNQRRKELAVVPR